MKNTFCAVLVLACVGAVIHAQTPSAKFEVASIKASDPNANIMTNPPRMQSANGRLTLDNIPLKVIVQTAWELQNFQVIGGPSDLLSRKFDIHAKAEDGFTGGIKEMRPLLRALLAERFALRTHMEKREMTVSALVIARSDGKLGSELKRSETQDCPDPEVSAQKLQDTMAKDGIAGAMAYMQSNPACAVVPVMPTAPPERGAPMTISMRFNSQPISQLTGMLTGFTGRLVQDRTGLTGLYDWTLSFDPSSLLGMLSQLGVSLPAGANLPPSDGTTIATAIQEQLGLKLQNERGQVDVLVIDGVELPTPD